MVYRNILNNPAPKGEYGNVVLLLKPIISKFGDKICSMAYFA